MKEKVTIEEIWEIERLAGKTGDPHELMAIQLLVEKKRKEYKEQMWELYHKQVPEESRDIWEQYTWAEPPVGYNPLKSVKFVMWDTTPEGKDKPPTDWAGNPLDENWNPIVPDTTP